MGSSPAIGTKRGCRIMALQGTSNAQMRVRFPSSAQIWGVAQLAERFVCNEKDAGSSPVTSTIRGSMYQGWRDCFASNLRWVQFPSAPQNAKIAQLVERHLAKVEVAGSSPVFRSKGELAHLVRVLAWQARGDRFDPGILHKNLIYMI